METMIINGEEWVRKQEPAPSSECKPDDWKTLFDKFCDGDCPRCTVFSNHNYDHRPCEIIWLQDYASVPADKKEEYLIKIKEYIKHERDRVISDAERELETANDEANKCACELAYVITSVCEGPASRDDIPSLIFKMLDLARDTTQARRKITEATERVKLVHEKIKEGKL